MASSQRICSIPDCGKRHSARGLCNSHYVAMRRAEDPDYSKRMFDRRERKNCSIGGCEKATRYGHLCEAHYTRLRRHGDPVGGGTSHGEPLTWIEDHLSHERDDCILWPYARNKGEEGVVTFQGRQVTASRAMCILAHGEPPADNYDAAHSCGHGHLACMNYRHLRWATRKENFADMEEHGTKLRGERSLKAKLTEAQVRQIRSLRGSKTLEDLSEQFGVHRATISLIHTRKNWAWLTD